MKKNANILTKEIQNFVYELPVVLGWMDEQSRVMGTTNYAAKLVGYKDVDAVLGLDHTRFNAFSEESAPLLRKQDQVVMSTKIKHSYLDIHTYMDDETRTFLTEKSPIVEGDIVTGCFCYCVELTHNDIRRMSAHFKRLIAEEISRNRKISRTLTICDTPDDIGLTKAEMKVAYYLLRGQTAKNTSELLNRSVRTVQNHLDRMKTKMDCDNKSQLIERLITLGCLDFFPRDFT